MLKKTWSKVYANIKQKTSNLRKMKNYSYALRITKTV